jgi:uncharacterized protein YqgV (UPF0045/DUF77 family)
VVSEPQEGGKQAGRDGAGAGEAVSGGTERAATPLPGAKGGGYQDTSVVGCQFSVYPLRQTDIDTPVQASIHAAREAGCGVRVGNLSTLIWGDEDQVFGALRAAFRAAQRHGPAVLTATLAAGMPTDELVGAIQSDVDAASRSGASRLARKDVG